MTYVVIYEHRPNEEGRETRSAYVPDLPGCVSGCKTLVECEAMIREAIELHIEGLREEGLSVP
jgi:predicted RNase H-like HicB family nuclease